MGGRRGIAFVVAGVAALALVGAAVAGTFVRWNGSLGHGYGNGVGVRIRAGQSFSVGMTAIRADRRVRIESVRAHDPSGGIVIAGVLVGTPGDMGLGTAIGFPPKSPSASLRPAEGAVIPPHADVALIVGFRGTRPGVFRVRGVDVHYRERWPGVEVKRLTHTGMLVVGCAVAADAGHANCRLPSMKP